MGSVLEKVEAVRVGEGERGRFGRRGLGGGQNFAFFFPLATLFLIYFFHFVWFFVELLWVPSVCSI